MRYFVVHYFSVQNHVTCVPAIKAKWIIFLSHRNRKFAGRKHNVLEPYVNVCALDHSGVVICNPFKWDILWFILINNLVFCVPTTLAKWILFRNYMIKKVVGGVHNVLAHYVNVCAPDPFGIGLCNPFKWDILCSFLIRKIMLFFVCLPQKEMNFIPQPKE